MWIGGGVHRDRNDVVWRGGAAGTAETTPSGSSSVCADTGHDHLGSVQENLDMLKGYGDGG